MFHPDHCLLLMPQVRAGVEALVIRCSIRTQQIFKVDGSRQSAHSNAYVTGFFGTKRVVIYDTLLSHLDAAGAHTANAFSSCP
jgi:STE24 endopeptidase